MKINLIFQWWQLKILRTWLKMLNTLGLYVMMKYLWWYWKKINPIIFIHLNHLFNTITRTKIYPSHLKVSKIIPILKPGKNKFEIGSYRPINISHPIDKLYQEFVKNHLLSFLNVNNIIVKNHQGGLKNMVLILLYH